MSAARVLSASWTAARAWPRAIKFAIALALHENTYVSMTQCDFYPVPSKNHYWTPYICAPIKNGHDALQSLEGIDMLTALYWLQAGWHSKFYVVVQRLHWKPTKFGWSAPRVGPKHTKGVYSSFCFDKKPYKFIGSKWHQKHHLHLKDEHSIWKSNIIVHNGPIVWYNSREWH